MSLPTGEKSYENFSRKLISKKKKKIKRLIILVYRVGAIISTDNPCKQLKYYPIQIL